MTIAFLATVIDEKGWSLKRWHGKESTSVAEGNLTGVVIGRNVFESFARKVIFTCVIEGKVSHIEAFTVGVSGEV